MDAFAIPLVVFTAFMIWLLVEVIRGSFEDPVPLRAGVVWAVTCPLAGLLLGVGLAEAAAVAAVVSALALGSLAYWFVASGTDDDGGETEEPVDPEPGPGDDLEPERLPDWATGRIDVDWDRFDRARIEWERNPAPSEPDREPLRQRR